MELLGCKQYFPNIFPIRGILQIRLKIRRGNFVNLVLSLPKTFNIYICLISRGTFFKSAFNKGTESLQHLILCAT